MAHKYHEGNKVADFLTNMGGYNIKLDMTHLHFIQETFLE